MAVPKINSAHGSDTRNVINRAIEVLNHLGIDVQTLVAEGQLTDEQYARLITTINGLIKSGHVDKGDLTSEFKDEIEGFSTQLAQKANDDEVRKKEIKLGLEDMSETTLAAIEGGEGTSFNLLSIPQDGSVTPEKTTFFTKTRNEFTGVYLKDMKLVGASTYSAVERNALNSRLAFLEVEPNTEYTMTIYDHEDVLNIIPYAESTLHIDDLVFSDSNNRASLVSQTISTGRNLPTTFTTKSDTKYLYIHVSNESAEPRLQIEKGSESTDYVLPFVFSSDLFGVFDDFLTTNGESWGVI